MSGPIPRIATLDDAAAWLADRTAEDWTPRRVLDTVIQHCAAEVDRSHRAAASQGVPRKDWHPSNPYTPLRVAPPPETEFIPHPVTTAHPPGKLHLQWPMPWVLVPLRLRDADQMYVAGAVMLKSIEGRGGTNAEDVPLFVEELRPPVRATFAEVRLPGAYVEALGELLAKPAQAPAARKQTGDAEWVTLAQIEARKIIKREAAADRYPPQIRIAEEIAADFRRRKPPIHGTDGKPLSGASIKRRALRGISSATKRARSTAIGRGK